MSGSASSRSAGRDLYKVLKVPRNASRADIKEAYRKLAMALHPDLNDGCDHKSEKFKHLNEAYDTLKDTDGKRREYDDEVNGFTRGAGGGGARGKRRPPPPNYRKVYSPRAPPGFKTFDNKRHFDMHYGDGMMKEEISAARKRYQAASERFATSEEGQYRSVLGKGFTFNGYDKTGGNPYSKRAPQGPDAARQRKGGPGSDPFAVEYEESHYYDLGSTDLGTSRKVVNRREEVRDRMADRRKNRIRNRGDPPKSYVVDEDGSSCAVM